MTFFGMALITAAATVVLAVFAIVTAWYARNAFRKQAEEVALLVEQSKRDAGELRRSQAAKVFLAAPDDPVQMVSPYAQNASSFPVYDAQLWYLEPGRFLGIDFEDLGTIMPGEARSGDPLSRRPTHSGTPTSRSGTRKASAGYACLSHELQTHRSARRAPRKPAIVSQLR
jgi:hypothetical protein